MSKEMTTKQIFGLMALAYAFSFLVRMIWVWQFQDTPSFIWNNQLMINTNDGYFFASGAQEALSGVHADNPRVFGIWDYGVIFFTTLFTKITPFSLETVILYMPAVISSLVVIPIILIAQLYNKPLWGFFSALLGSIAWSYYNRTMVGYYDTDMFSAMAPMVILYFLIRSTFAMNLRIALYAALAIVLYPFLYDQGLSIVYAMGIIYGAYMLWYHRASSVTYGSLILIFLALIPLGLAKPMVYIVHLLLVFGAYMLLTKKDFSQKELQIASLVAFLFFMLFGNVFGLIFTKVTHYLATGTSSEGLHFYSVVQTVREAGKIPFSTFANRISGSEVGVILSLLGYIVLVVKHRAFILALPLIGVGVFALWGGLRFTVYAVPVAAMSVVYLFFVIGEFIQDKKFRYAFIVVATAGMIAPNITHIIGYKVPTVLKKAEVEDLVKLNNVASPKDYTLTWWDYGYPIWYYSDTSTLIDGGKHHNDNFIISTIMQTTSPQLAANLSRLAVETYVDSNYSVVANKLFEGKDPNRLLDALKRSDYKLPKKTRDVFLYAPYRMMRIFPTVAVFGNLDLTTGKQKRRMAFYMTALKSSKKGKLAFRNGIVFDMKQGRIFLGKQQKRVRTFAIVQEHKDGKTSVEEEHYYRDGEYVIVYLKSYGKFVVMDTQTFHSMYVQMFLLGKYDKTLFEPVVSSLYSRVYKLKR